MSRLPWSRQLGNGHFPVNISPCQTFQLPDVLLPATHLLDLLSEHHAMRCVL